MSNNYTPSITLPYHLPLPTQTPKHRSWNFPPSSKPPKMKLTKELPNKSLSITLKKFNLKKKPPHKQNMEPYSTSNPKSFTKIMFKPSFNTFLDSKATQHSTRNITHPTILLSKDKHPYAMTQPTTPPPTIAQTHGMAMMASS